MAFANLGTAPIDVPHDAINVRQYSPGRLSDDQLARELSAADLFLAPYEDGVSMRRTTLAAALQHSLAVVGTDGRNTETELRETHALRLAPVTDSGAFADIALALAQNAGQRDELRSQARAFFDRHLSWPVIAAKYRAVLEAVVGGPID
jgi:glycosyltransferase involved in cell wall biosynthesis